MIDTLTDGLVTATRLVRQGGKIVALSRTEGELGQALKRLTELDDPRDAPSALKALVGEPDYSTARRLAHVLSWADVYLLSSLDPGDVTGLAMISLDHPEEARRLVATSPSCLFVSQADRVRAEVAGEPE